MGLYMYTHADVYSEVWTSQKSLVHPMQLLQAIVAAVLVGSIHLRTCSAPHEHDQNIDITCTPGTNATYI